VSAAIELAGVSVRVRGRTILDVGALTVGRGEVVGVVGPNGAGKSTLLQVCLGLRRPQQGRVVVLGQDVGRARGAGLARLRCAIGDVPQTLAHDGPMPLTLREVVVIGRTGRAGLLRPLGRGDWLVVDAWIERMGLGRLAGAAYGELSGGEQRKALIARAMVQEPALLLLDEPAAYLDLAWREQIVATLDGLVGAGGPAVVIVSHELEVLPVCCRRLVVLQAGRPVADGAPEAVLTAERVQAVWGTGLGVRHAGGRHLVVPASAVRA
jgi:ABC-type cobalamin/Fe3+-siderophores transport system ATPase subunit